MKNISITFFLFIFTSLLYLSGCTGAYSSHHGNRAARYNSVPYNSAYRYNHYNHTGAYMGRPYRRF